MGRRAEAEPLGQGRTAGCVYCYVCPAQHRFTGRAGVLFTGVATLHVRCFQARSFKKDMLRSPQVAACHALPQPRPAETPAPLHAPTLTQHPGRPPVPQTPPRGLQLHLGPPSAPHAVDTLVMANLAYFQLKAGPGRWLLSLAPGRWVHVY